MKLEVDIANDAYVITLTGLDLTTLPFDAGNALAAEFTQANSISKKLSVLSVAAGLLEQLKTVS